MGSVGNNQSVVTKTLYHGTDIGNIEEFKSTGKESSGAIFFADDPDYAEEEAYVKNERSGNGQYMYEVKLDIKNPMYVTLPQDEFAMNNVEKRYIEEAKAKGHDAVIFTNNVPDDDIMKQTFYAVFDSKQVRIQNKRKL